MLLGFRGRLIHQDLAFVFNRIDGFIDFTFFGKVRRKIKRWFEKYNTVYVKLKLKRNYTYPS